MLVLTRGWRILLPLAYMAAVFLLSSIPGDIDTDSTVGAVFQWVSPRWQNLLHIPLYGGLTLSWSWALQAYPQSRTNRLATAFLLAATWGVLDEIHQSTVPGRFASWTDISLNLLGAGLALGYALRGGRRTT